MQEHQVEIYGLPLSKNKFKKIMAKKEPKTLQDIFSDYKSLELNDRINFVIAAKE